MFETRFFRRTGGSRQSCRRVSSVVALVEGDDVAREVGAVSSEDCQFSHGIWKSASESPSPGTLPFFHSTGVREARQRAHIL